jgi:hypothetical protein
MRPATAAPAEPDEIAERDLNRAEQARGGSIDGTHHHISEFDFRYSTRAMTDRARMARLMGQVEGRRLSYKRIKGA